MAQAAISAERYFSSVPETSQEVWKDCVGNSWPLPNSSASFSVLSLGLASAALSLPKRHISAPVFAVTMSICFCLPKQMSTSWSLVVDIFLHLLAGGRRLALRPPGYHRRHQHFGCCVEF